MIRKIGGVVRILFVATAVLACAPVSVPYHFWRKRREGRKRVAHGEHYQDVAAILNVDPATAKRWRDSVTPSEGIAEKR